MYPDIELEWEIDEREAAFDEAVREEARGLLLPTAIFARWSKD